MNERFFEALRCGRLDRHDTRGVLVAVATDHLFVRARGGAEVAAARSGVAAMSVPGGLFGF